MESKIARIKGLIERMRIEEAEPGITVGQIASENARDFAEDSPAAVIVNTVLAMRQRWETANPRFKQFKTRYPDMRTLSDLKSLVGSMNERDFCRKVLGINIGRTGFWRYRMLRALTEAFASYKRRPTVLSGRRAA